MLASPRSRDTATKTTILLVDGTTSGRNLTASMLRGLGYTVESSGDAFYALALLASDVTVRAVVVDMDPGASFDARSLVAQLLSLRPGLPVVLYTASAEKFTGRHISSKLRVLHKPFNMNDLSKAISEAVKLAAQRNTRGGEAAEGPQPPPG